MICDYCGTLLVPPVDCKMCYGEDDSSDCEWFCPNCEPCCGC